MSVIDLLTDVVLIVTGFQLVLLTGVLLVRLPAASLRRNLLAAFLLAKAFMILRWFVVRFEIVSAAEWPLSYLTSCAVFFALAPLLYLYVRTLCYRDFRLRPVHLAHLLPLVAMASFATLAWWVAFAGGSTGSVHLDHWIDQRFWNVFWCTNLVQIALYIAVMFRALRGYRRRLEHVHSVTVREDLGWLHGLLLVLSLHWLFVTARSTVGLLDLRIDGLTAVLDLFSISIFLVFTTVLVVRGLSHVKHFPGIDEASPPTDPPISNDELERCAERLVRFMHSEKPHLDPFLSLEDLALRLSVPSWQLSRALNTVLGRNFFLFVNAHRVDEAKTRLSDPSRRDATMLRVLHESGFNSKSTFNEAFKRETGMTPSEYRDRHGRRQSIDETLPAAACR